MNSPLLSLTVFLPLAGAVLCLLVPKASAPRACRWINVVANAAAFLATVAVWAAYGRHEGMRDGPCLQAFDLHRQHLRSAVVSAGLAIS